MRMPMQKWIAAYVVTAALLLATIPARAQYGAVKLETRKQCLSDKDLDTIRLLKSLKRFIRPTKIR
jgi:hypothetical protein